MPGFDLFNNRNDNVTSPETASEVLINSVENIVDRVYYNPRLDAKNYLEGPLSYNPATRLRQMLARPGIVVSCLRLE